MVPGDLTFSSPSRILEAQAARRESVGEECLLSSKAVPAGPEGDGGDPEAGESSPATIEVLCAAALRQRS